MDIPPTGGRDGRGVIAGGGDLLLPPPEHSGTVYCNQAHYGPVSSSGAKSRVKVDQEVVVSGRVGCAGNADGDIGGGTEGRGGADRTETDTD